MLYMLGVSVYVTISYRLFNIQPIAITPTPLAILGTALAILLGFRNNAAYDRWWEARRLWGNLLNECRALARATISYTSLHSKSSDEDIKSWQRQIIYRQIAFIYSCCFFLRRQDPFIHLSRFVSEEEMAWLRPQQHVPLALLLQQGIHLNHAEKEGWIMPVFHMNLNTFLNNCNEAIGGCERIKNTVFPRQYSYYTTIFVWLFVTALPFGLVRDLGFFTILASLLIGFIFFVLETVGRLIENPFENSINDVPMLAISRTADINLRQMLGETDLPEPMQPIEGYLY